MVQNHSDMWRLSSSSLFVVAIVVGNTAAFTSTTTTSTFRRIRQVSTRIASSSNSNNNKNGKNELFSDSSQYEDDDTTLSDDRYLSFSSSFLDEEDNGNNDDQYLRSSSSFLDDEESLLTSLFEDKLELDDFLSSVDEFMLSDYESDATTTSSAIMIKEEENVEKDDNTSASSDSDVMKARLLVLAAAALYGTNFSFVKLLGETGMSVGLTSMLRFFMAALITLPWLLKPPSSSCKNDNDNDNDNDNTNWFDSPEMQVTLGGLEVGAWNSIGYVSQAVGLATTSASKSAFLCSMAVVVVPFLDFLVGKKMVPKQLIGALFAVAGVALLEMSPSATADVIAGGNNAALSTEDLCSLFQPFAFGMGFWRMENVMKRHPDEAQRGTAAQLFAVFVGTAIYAVLAGNGGGDTLAPEVVDAVTTTTTAAAATMITPHHWDHDPQSPMEIIEWLRSDPVVFLELFWTGVVTTAFTVYMETLAMKTLRASEVTLLFSSEPLWGTACASFVMGEQLGLNAACGAVLVLSGCIFSIDLGGGSSSSTNDDDKVLEADGDDEVHDDISPMDGNRDKASFFSPKILFSESNNITIRNKKQKVKRDLTLACSRVFPSFLTRRNGGGGGSDRSG